MSVYEIKIRPMVFDDLERVLESQAVGLIEGKKVIPNYAWSAEDFVEAVRQRRSQKRNSYETVALVATTRVELKPRTFTDWVCGACVCEIRPDHYYIRQISSHFEGPRGDAFDAMLEWVKGRSSRVFGGVVVAEVDDRNWWVLCELQNRGFKLSRGEKDKYGVVKSWRLTYEPGPERSKAKGDGEVARSL